MNEMPPGGVKELVKTADGRRYLSQLQKRHEIDILQPSDPRFMQVYGSKFKREKTVRERQERMSRDEWTSLEDKKKYGKEKGKRKIIV